MTKLNLAFLRRVDVMGTNFDSWPQPNAAEIENFLRPDGIPIFFCYPIDFVLNIVKFVS